MNLRLTAMAATVLLFAGCADTSQVMIGSAYPSIAPEQVHIYYQPPAHYREVALLETHSGSFTYGEQHKMDAVLNNLRTQAAKLGANGVLFEGTANGYGGSNVGVGVGGESYGSHSNVGVGVGFSISPTPKYARGMAIYVTDPTLPEAAAGSPPQPPPR